MRLRYWAHALVGIAEELKGVHEAAPAEIVVELAVPAHDRQQQFQSRRGIAEQDLERRQPVQLLEICRRLQ